MEAEKLKAVELAVEGERRRVAEKKEQERRIMEQEKEEAGRLREEAKVEREAGRAALLGAHESQARQVELVNRLQVDQYIFAFLLNMGNNDDIFVVIKTLLSCSASVCLMKVIVCAFV